MSIGNLIKLSFFVEKKARPRFHAETQKNSQKQDTAKLIFFNGNTDPGQAGIGTVPFAVQKITASTNLNESFTVFIISGVHLTVF